MISFYPRIVIPALIVLSLLVSCSKPIDAPAPTAEEVNVVSEGGKHYVDRIEIKQGDLIIDEIRIDEERWLGEVAVYIRLPYDTMSWAADEPEEAFAAWDSIVVGGSPALVVQEYVSGGSAPGSHRWLMRIFLWEDGALRELPPIPGSGEVYYFKDLNQDGSMEFINQEGIGPLDSPEGELPLSPWVHRFNGEDYEPTTGAEAWPEIWARINKRYR